MSVAKSYARALYEAAKDAKAGPEMIGQLESQLDEMTRFIDSSKEVKVALYSPVTNTREKSSLVEAFSQRMGVQKLLGQFLVLLARKDRLPLLPKIRDAFTTVRLDMEGGLGGTLVSAEPMSNTDVEGLAKAFSQKLDKKVAFRVSTDSALLAGVKVTVNGVTYDGTLRSQLQRLKDKLVSQVAV